MADSDIPPTPDPGVEVIPDPADVEKNKVFAILAYLGILVLVPILAAKDSPFARYHANQGLILFVGAIAAAISMVIIIFILGHIPFLGTIAVCCLGPIVWVVFMLACLVFTVLGILNAVGGKMKPLPVIGTLITIIK